MGSALILDDRFPGGGGGSADRPPAGRAQVVLGLVFLLFVSLAAAVPIASGNTNQPGRAELAAEITDLMRQDRRAEALPLCRIYSDSFPDDPVMLYNLACLENAAGNPEAAVASFTKAVAAGFDDFARAFSDPDLADLKYHPALVNLSLEHQLSLSKAAEARAQTLSWQEKSPAVNLTPDRADLATGSPDIRLTWTPAGLDIDLAAAGPWSELVGPGNLAPWNGGPGLVVTLGIPDSDSDDDFQTANHYLFAFGMENGNALGAAYLAGQDRWQAIAELQPKIRQDAAGNLELRATIPWAGILPYHPLVDNRLGFNAAVRLTGPGVPQGAALLADPASFRPRSAVRRIVPLIFLVDSVGQEVFAGKVANTISGSEPITFELTAVSLTEGTGRLTLDFLGGPDQSLLPQGKVSGSLELTKGFNHLTRRADFTALKTGPYLIKAEMMFPSGRSLVWGSTVLQLAAGWRAEFTARIDNLPPHEKPTAQYHLESIEQAVAAHHRRRGPETIVTTLEELGRMLDSAEQNGSVLPDKGTFLAVYPGPDGEPRPCHLYLPPGWKIAQRLNPVITVTDVPGLPGAIAGRIGLNYEQGRQTPTLKAGSDLGFPVYLVPRLGPPSVRRPGDPQIDPVAETEACLAWARDSFGTPSVSLAGVDRAAETALRLAQTRPEDLKAMIIFAGDDIEPWPQANLDFIKGQLTGFPRELAVTWLDFSGETGTAGQGQLILRAMVEMDYGNLTVQEVRGGLNFTQIADRTVLWAEDLR